jgi:two-component system cell cycle sensor histidine kinase/response regulator CckA
MDDEETIQLLLRESLTLMGFEVVVTVDGKGAVLAYAQSMQENVPSFDVVLMDLVVKEGMGGHEAGGEILKQDPRARLIATSGDCSDPVMLHPHLYGFAGKVAKPFNLKALSSFVRQICAG